MSRKPVAQYASLSIHCHESTEKAFLGCIEFVAVLLDIDSQSLVRGGRWVYVNVYFRAKNNYNCTLFEMGSKFLPYLEEISYNSFLGSRWRGG